MFLEEEKSNGDVIRNNSFLPFWFIWYMKPVWPWIVCYPLPSLSPLSLLLMSSMGRSLDDFQIKLQILRKGWSNSCVEPDSKKWAHVPWTHFLSSLRAVLTLMHLWDFYGFLGKAVMSDKSPSNDRSHWQNVQIKRIKQLGSYPLLI